MKDFARHTPYAIAVLAIAALCNYSMQAGLTDKPVKQFDIQTLIEIDEPKQPATVPLPTQKEVLELGELPPVQTQTAELPPLESYRPNTLQDNSQPDEIAKLKTRVDKLERAILIVAGKAGITKENPDGNFPKPQSTKYKTGSGSTGGGGSTGGSTGGSGGSTGNTTSTVYYSSPVVSNTVSPVTVSAPVTYYQPPTYYQAPTVYRSATPATTTTTYTCNGNVCVPQVTVVPQSTTIVRPRLFRP